MPGYYQCVNCGDRRFYPEPPLWLQPCPVCGKPLGLPVEERRYCPASALHDEHATPLPSCPFALDCKFANDCPSAAGGEFPKETE